MTDFVCHIRSMTTSELCNTYPKKFVMPVWKGDQSEMVKDMLSIDAIKWDMTGEYMKFLKQPLTLSMFVCVSEAREVLEEPNPSIYFPTNKLPDDFTDSDKVGLDRYGFALMEYESAKDKILFEGFEVLDDYLSFDDTVIKSNETGLMNWVQNLGFYGKNYLTIENLTEYSLTLTPNALKLIYG